MDRSLMVFACASGMLVAAPVSAQRGADSTTQARVAGSSVSNTAPRPSEGLGTEAAFQDRLASIERDQATLRARVDAATNALQIAVWIMGSVLAIGTLTSVFGFIRTEIRATQAHKFALSSAAEAETRVKDAFKLGISGETSSQARATQVHEAFLTGSKETLDLVNATLNLAKEASERAARTIESRARLTIEELDQASQSLLASVPAQDDRALIANPGTRSNLRSLAQKISGFEINRFILPDTLQLTPSCIFIRAMDFHLNQQFEDAFRSWESVALSASASASLRSLAWYWIGYEQNNLNRFSEAEQSFENAAQFAEGIPGGRRLELQRIIFETRFFNKLHHPAETLVVPLQQLLASIDEQRPSEERDSRRAKVVVTLANVIYQSGKDVVSADNKAAAAPLFSQAADLYRSVRRQDKWAEFGLAEMLNLSDDNSQRKEAQEIFRRFRQVATDESVRREEPRTKVLARTTELICCLNVPEIQHEATAIRSVVLQELGRVDERLTVYSQMQRRNVPKPEFQDNLDKLVAASGTS